MINTLGQVMLYVNDPDRARRFWTEKAGFKLAAEGSDMGIRWIEVTPAGGGASLVIHSKEDVAKLHPDMHLGTPSLMFYADDVEGLFADYKSRGITVGELVEISIGRVFNFADDEDNYFAVLQRN